MSQVFTPRPTILVVTALPEENDAVVATLRGVKPFSPPRDQRG